MAVFKKTQLSIKSIIIKLTKCRSSNFFWKQSHTLTVRTRKPNLQQIVPPHWYILNKNKLNRN